MLKRVKEVDGIETIAGLRAALESVPDEMPICDALGEPLLLIWYEDTETGDLSLEVG